MITIKPAIAFAVTAKEKYILHCYFDLNKLWNKAYKCYAHRWKLDMHGKSNYLVH